MKSPLSELPPQKIRDLPRSFILDQLEIYYGQRPPDDAVDSDYSLWRCAETKLEFAWPVRPGNLCFYEWISRFDSYYPGARWEYGEVARMIANCNEGVLDVGCGDGEFLRGLGGNASGKFAVDLNESAIKACRALGFQSFCGTIDAAIKADFLKPGTFPVVTSFHCLEHVEDPVGFMRSLVQLVAPGGRLFVSTPYSPMSFESDWFDVLNHPPHHMTRWNRKAYEKLAALLGMKMRWFVPESTALLRTLSVFIAVSYGPHRPIGKGRLLRDLVLKSPSFFRLYAKQSRRGRDVGEGIAADVILVELTPNDQAPG